MVDVVPAILSYSKEDMLRKAESVKGAALAIHIDIMDGKFVQNRTIGVAEAKDLQWGGQIEYHLMVQNPAEYIEALQGGPNVTYQVHIEAAEGQIPMLLNLAGRKKAKLSIAISPGTGIDAIRQFLPLVKHILIMTVVPGKDGQKYMPEMEGKIAALRQLAPGAIIEVDGGINSATAQLAVKAGANRLAAATSVFGAPHPADAYRQMAIIANTAAP